MSKESLTGHCWIGENKWWGKYLCLYGRLIGSSSRVLYKKNFQLWLPIVVIYTQWHTWEQAASRTHKGYYRLGSKRRPNRFISQNKYHTIQGSLRVNSPSIVVEHILRPPDINSLVPDSVVSVDWSKAAGDCAGINRPVMSFSVVIPHRQHVEVVTTQASVRFGWSQILAGTTTSVCIEWWPCFTRGYIRKSTKVEYNGVQACRNWDKNQVVMSSTSTCRINLNKDFP